MRAWLCSGARRATPSSAIRCSNAATRACKRRFCAQLLLLGKLVGILGPQFGNDGQGRFERQPSTIAGQPPQPIPASPDHN